MTRNARHPTIAHVARVARLRSIGDVARAARIPRALVAPLALAATLLAAEPAFAGPPWMAVEYPANPLHPDSRGALLLVHTFHHGTAVEYPLTGYAEGIVRGERVRRELTIATTYRTGVYAVRGDLDGGTAWMLVLSMTDGDRNVMESMLVALNGDRALTAVDIPNANGDDWSGPRAATREQIDRFLDASQALAQAQPGVGRVRTVAAEAPRDLGAGALIAGLLLVPAALVGIRRSRRHESRTAGAPTPGADSEA